MILVSHASVKLVSAEVFPLFGVVQLALLWVISFGFNSGHKVALFKYLFGSMAYFVLGCGFLLCYLNLSLILLLIFNFMFLATRGHCTSTSVVVFLPWLSLCNIWCFSMPSVDLMAQFSDFLILATRGHCISTFMILSFSWFLLCWICNRLGCLHHKASLKHLNLPHFSFGHQVALFMYLSDDIAYFVLSLWISNVFSILSTVLVAHFQFYVIGHQGALH